MSFHAMKNEDPYTDTATSCYSAQCCIRDSCTAIDFMFCFSVVWMRGSHIFCFCTLRPVLCESPFRDCISTESATQRTTCLYTGNICCLRRLHVPASAFTLCEGRDKISVLASTNSQAACPSRNLRPANVSPASCQFCTIFSVFCCRRAAMVSDVVFLNRRRHCSTH